jgi:hypothetical protein
MRARGVAGRHGYPIIRQERPGDHPRLKLDCCAQKVTDLKFDIIRGVS